jgi:hypothetical protein
LNHPKTELALQFLPSHAWSLGGGVVLEDKNIWKIDIFQDRDASLKFFFFLNGSIFGGNLYSGFTHSQFLERLEGEGWNMFVSFKKSF